MFQLYLGDQNFWPLIFQNFEEHVLLKYHCSIWYTCIHIVTGHPFFKNQKLEEEKTFSEIIHEHHFNMGNIVFMKCNKNNAGIRNVEMVFFPIWRHFFLRYCITGNFCDNLISEVFCGQLRTAEIKIAEYYVK